MEENKNDDMDDAEAPAATEASEPEETMTDVGNPGSRWSRAKEASAAMTSQAVVEELERQYVCIKQDRDNLLSQLDEVKKQLKSANESLCSQQVLEDQVTECRRQLDLAKGQTASLEEEKKIVEERLGRLREESDNLREEISLLTKSNAELSKSVADQEIQSKLKESEAVPLYHEKQRLQTELDSLQSHANWLEQEVAARLKDYQRLQQESRDRAIQMQSQMDHISGEKEAADTRYEALRRIEQDLQKQVEELSRDLLQIKHELSDLRESSQIEVREERRVVELQKNHLERWEQRYNDAVSENESLKKAAAEAMEASEKELERERNELESKFSKLLHEQAAEYEEKLKSLREHEPEPRALALATRAAASAPDVDEEPLSLTDLYTRLEDTKDALVKEKKDCRHWKLLFERVQREVAEKAPMIIRQRQEYELVVEQNLDYRKRLEQALVEKQDSREDTREARQEADTWKRRFDEQRVESRELAKQVQAMLVSRSGGQPPADVPTSIEEMQSQNQRLLMEHQRLTDRVAELEENLERNTSKTELEAANAELASLRGERKRQEELVGGLVQQRDLYRSMLAEHDSKILEAGSGDVSAVSLAKESSERARMLEDRNKELESLLAVFKGNIDSLAREKQAMTERLSRYEALTAELTQNVDRLERDKLSAAGEIARSQSDAKYHKEKCERLDESLERTRSELATVSGAKSELQRINLELQQNLSAENAKCTRLEGERREVESKVRLIEAQAQTAKASENRLMDENRQLRAEVARQGSAMDGIRRIESSLSAKSEGEKEILKEELKKTSQLRASEQAKFARESDDLKSRIHELEARNQALERSKDKSQIEALDARKQLLDSKSELESLSAKCDRLESQLRSAKKRLGEGDASDDAEATMQTRLADLTSELESVRSDIASWKERASNYQKIAKENEAAHADLRKATGDFKVEQEKKIQQLKTQLEDMKKDAASKQEIVAELTTDLAAERGERDKLEAELQAQILDLKTAIETNEKDTESARARADALRLDLDTLSKEAASAQNNYERELKLHSEARTALRVAREQAEEEGRLRNASEGKLESLKKEVEEQRSARELETHSLEEELKNLGARLQEASEQNKVLHSQIDTLNSLVERNQATRIAAAGEEAGGEEVSGELADLHKSNSELREVVKFLKSENEMILSQLDVAKRTADRERAAASLARHSMDEARAELQALRSGNDGEGTIPADSNDNDSLSEKLRTSEEQCSLLGDSNKLLREESRKLRERLASAQAEVAALKTSMKPAEKAQRDLEMKIASVEAEKASLERDLESWKNRVTSLVSKFNQIDPEEHKKVVTENAELKKEKDSLNAWKKATEEESTRIRNICKNLNMKNREQKQLIDSQKKDIEKLGKEKASMAKATSLDSSAVKERDALKEKVATMEAQAQSVKKELEGANNRNDRLRDMLRQFQTTIRELKEEKQQLQKAAAQAASPAQPSAKKSDVGVAEGKEAASQQDSAAKPVPDDTVPRVPPGGFKFGPSAASSRSESAAAVAVAARTSPVRTEQTHRSGGEASPKLRADAQSFIPKLASEGAVKTVSEANKDKDAESAKESQARTVAAASGGVVGKREAPSQITGESEPKRIRSLESAKSETPSQSAGGEGGATRRLSGAKKEMSMKERLLERKRQLLLAKQRKKEAEMAASKAQADASEDNPTIRAKMTEEAVSAAPVTETKEPAEASEAEGEKAKRTPEAKDAAAVEAAQVGSSVATSEQGAAASTASKIGEKEQAKTIILEGKDSSTGEKGQKAEKVEEAKVDVTEEAKQTDTPFGSGQSKESGSRFSSPTTFGQSSTIAATTFGTKPSDPASDPASGSAGFGPAFLNIKPPSSSTTAPVFQFGKSAEIKLPTPAQNAPAPSPFSSFGAGSSFPGFASGGAAAGMQSRPLFSAPAPQEENEEAAVAEEEMDAEAAPDGAHETTTDE